MHIIGLTVTNVSVCLLLASLLHGYTILQNRHSNVYTADDNIDINCHLSVTPEVQHGDVSDQLFSHTVENMLYGTQQNVGLLDGMIGIFTKTDDIKFYIFDQLLKSVIARDVIERTNFNMTSQLHCDGGSGMNKTQVVTCFESIKELFTKYSLTLQNIQSSSACFDTNVFRELFSKLRNLSLEINRVLCTMTMNGLMLLTSRTPEVRSYDGVIANCSTSDESVTRMGMLSMIYQLNYKIAEDTRNVGDEAGPICPYPGCSFSLWVPHNVEIIG